MFLSLKSQGNQINDRTSVDFYIMSMMKGASIVRIFHPVLAHIDCLTSPISF